VRGDYTNKAPPDRKKLGSILFAPRRLRTRLAADAQLSVLGFSRLLSNADLAAHNAGLADAGTVRLQVLVEVRPSRLSTSDRKAF